MDLVFYNRYNGNILVYSNGENIMRYLQEPRGIVTRDLAGYTLLISAQSVREELI